MESPQHVFGGGPPAQLYLPSDWFNFLADADDDVAARRRYEALMTRVFPRMPRDGHREIVEGLMLWRERLWSNGILAHGVISVPAGRETAQTLWQVMIATMRLPSTSHEFDSSVMLKRMIGQSSLSHATHVESFETEMGLGIGMIGRPPAGLPANSTQPPVTTGMAAALSWAPGADHGISVIGVCQNPEQDRLLATLVALIAGHSRLLTEEGSPGE